jgi:hypothetical protein
MTLEQFNSMKRIMREEYTKRLKKFLAEEMTVEYGKGTDKISLIKGARGLKVRHDKTGLEYIIWNFDEAAGNVILLLPDESRLENEGIPSTAKLYEADSDGDGIPDEIDNDIDDMRQMLDNPEERQMRKVSTDKLNLINYNKKSSNATAIDKKFIIVPLEQFIKDYSL